MTWMLIGAAAVAVSAVIGSLRRQQPVPVPVPVETDRYRRAVGATRPAGEAPGRR